CRLEAECGDLTDTWHGHEPSNLRIMTCQLQNFTVEIVGLLLDGLTCLKQRPDHRDQLGTILDQLLGPHSKNIELGTANHETDVLEQATVWFSRSRLILTSNARLASSALTEWLSRSLTRTSLNQPVCMIRAMPAASLRSLLLICILSTALAWRASMQIT